MSDEKPESLMGAAYDAHVASIREWSDKCAALTKERDDLRKALEPFAKFARYVSVADFPDADQIFAVRAGGIEAASVTAADFRKLLAALTGKD